MDGSDDYVTWDEADFGSDEGAVGYNTYYDSKPVSPSHRSIPISSARDSSIIRQLTDQVATLMDRVDSLQPTNLIPNYNFGINRSVVTMSNATPRTSVTLPTYSILTNPCQPTVLPLTQSISYPYPSITRAVSSVPTSVFLKFRIVNM